MIKGWYVLHVRTGDELKVLEQIRKDLPGVPALVARQTVRERKGGQWTDKEKLLFPGYVFACAAMTPEVYYRLTGLPGVMGILRGASNVPTPVPDSEMRFVLRFAKDGEVPGISDLVMDGDRVRVVSGPLQGYEGQIVKLEKRRYRARIRLSLMGREQEIEMSVNIIEKTV